ncbi:hypothetical protein EIP86_010430 [Pleurotus ostreatoroseus]|nr:hypothetical protein EIP86_010430 [Pleurotus ostreatoroseus]
MNNQNMFQETRHVHNRTQIEAQIETQQQELRRTPEDRSQQRQLIATTIRALREQLNALAPISRLKPEVLSHIFLVYANSLNDDKPRKKKEPLRWLLLLHICHHWRCTAIAMAQLWALLPLTRKDYVEFALDRAASAPLSIRSVLEPHEDVHCTYQLLRPKTSQIRAIDFTVTGSTVRWLRKLAPLAGGDCSPLLEELRLDFKVDIEPFALREVASLSLPRLRTLALMNTSYSLASSLVRPTLTHLEIRFRHRVYSIKALDLLDELSLLQHLDLRNLHEDIPDFNTTIPLRTILMPHLHYVRLSGAEPNLGMARLLQCLAFSEKTHIYFQASVLTPYSEEYKTTPLLVIDSGYRVDDSESAVPILNPLDLSEVSVLELLPQSWSKQHKWMNILRNLELPKLERIVISKMGNDSCEAVLKALGTAIPAAAGVDPTSAVHQQGHGERLTTPESSPRYLFPTLKTLVIDGLYPMNLEKTLLPQMNAKLGARAQADYKLERLVLNVRGAITPHSVAGCDPLIAKSVKINKWLGLAESLSSVPWH